MQISTIRHLRNQQPFEPFKIRTASGGTFLVAHPENLSISLSGKTIGVMGADEAVDLIAVALVNELAPVRDEASAP